MSPQPPELQFASELGALVDIWLEDVTPAAMCGLLMMKVRGIQDAALKEEEERQQADMERLLVSGTFTRGEPSDDE